MTLHTLLFIPAALLARPRSTHTGSEKWKSGQEVQDDIIWILYVTARARRSLAKGLFWAHFSCLALSILVWESGWKDGRSDGWWMDGWLRATGDALQQYLSDKERHRWPPRAGWQSGRPMAGHNRSRWILALILGFLFFCFFFAFFNK